MNNWQLGGCHIKMDKFNDLLCEFRLTRIQAHLMALNGEYCGNESIVHTHH
jgi:hypothetical protein